MKYRLVRAACLLLATCSAHAVNDLPGGPADGHERPTPAAEPRPPADAEPGPLSGYRAGSVDDPKGKEGLTALTAAALDLLAKK
mgnify:CR=1 FL=1